MRSRCSEALCPCQLAFAHVERQHTRAHRYGHLQEEQAFTATADDADRIAWGWLPHSERVDRDSERL